MAIDTLPYVRALEAAGVDRHVAEAQAEALAHLLSELPTKADIAGLATKADFAELKADLAEIKGRLSNLPSAIHLLFMQAALVLAIFAGAFGLLKLTGHAG
jgi:hypothetical protein